MVVKFSVVQQKYGVTGKGVLKYFAKAQSTEESATTGALQAVSTITYALIYFYAVNIFKNLRQLFSGSKAITFIHYLISVEVLQKLPHLNRFLSKDYRENRDLRRTKLPLHAIRSRRAITPCSWHSKYFCTTKTL
jgi:hypothetical protein